MLWRIPQTRIKNKGKKKSSLLWLNFTKNVFWWLLLLGILTFSIYLASGSLTSGTLIAAANQVEKRPAEILYRSQQELNDQSGNTWQVVLLKRDYPGELYVNLRLVGFPGAAELIHPQPLRITTATGKVFTAADVFLEDAPIPTIGQYDLKDILPKLPAEELVLGIPQPGQHFVNISVPEAVVQEWQRRDASRYNGGNPPKF